MLLVKTKIGPSPIHGIGCFADEFIPKGTKIWVFKKGFDIRYDEKFFEELSESAKKQFLNYTYKNPKTGLYVLCADDARFFNHSDNPNTDDADFDFPTEESEGVTRAARDIQPGEEITSNYKSFDGEFRSKGIL